MITWVAGGTALTILLFAGATGAAGIDVSHSIATGHAGGQGFLAPLVGATVSQGFGCTNLTFEPTNPSCPSGHWHSGIDLAAPAGRPVVATMAGIATVVASTQGYGLHIIVDHGGGLSSLYGHLSSTAVTNRSPVDAGQVIGLVGSTGNSTGPHLHLEIRRDNIPEDPANDMTLP